MVLQKSGVGTAALLWKVKKSEDSLELTGVDGSPTSWNGKLSVKFSLISSIRKPKKAKIAIIIFFNYVFSPNLFILRT